MPKINQEEYEVLKELDDKWKWIARDGKGELWAYRRKPTKESTFWREGILMGLNNGILQFIQWEDEEPHNIAELIEEYESEETEVKKDLDWLNNEVEKRIEKIKTDEVSFAGSDFFDEGYIHGMRDVQAIANQLDEPEVLSQEWIDEHEKRERLMGPFGNVYLQHVVPSRFLQNLLVPKQEEVDQAYKDGYEKGKQHTFYKGYLEGLADKEKEPETVARVLVDYLIASAKLKLALSMEVEELEE